MDINILITLLIVSDISPVTSLQIFFQSPTTYFPYSVQIVSRKAGVTILTSGKGDLGQGLLPEIKRNRSW